MHEVSLCENVLVIKIFQSPGFLVLTNCRHFLQLRSLGPCSASRAGPPPSFSGKYALKTQDGSSQTQSRGCRWRVAPGVWFLVFRAPYMQVDGGILHSFQTEQSGRPWHIGDISLLVATLTGCSNGCLFHVFTMNPEPIKEPGFAFPGS